MTQCSVSCDREVGRQTESSAEEASWATPAFSLWIRPTFFARPEGGAGRTFSAVLLSSSDPHP